MKSPGASNGLPREVVGVSAPLDQASIEAIAHKVADLLRRRGEPGQSALLTAGQVATRFGVDRSWVYTHAHHLGVVRLGLGPRPRLRFDPAVVAQRLLAQQVAPTSAAPARGAAGSAPLLPIRSQARRPTRTLGGETPPPGA